MTSGVRLAAVSLDGSDPAGLADFYRQFLGLEPYFESEDFVALRGRVSSSPSSGSPTTSRPTGRTGPSRSRSTSSWPSRTWSPPSPRALALGATKADEQPNPDHWRVLVDPAGHPFCITTLIPDD